MIIGIFTGFCAETLILQAGEYFCNVPQAYLMETLETIYGSFNVYVNRVITEEEMLLHISFVDKQNKTHIVLMKYILGKWSFDQPERYPDWVIGLKDEFINLVAKNSIREFRDALN